jgi:hypothetical protein
LDRRYIIMDVKEIMRGTLASVATKKGKNEDLNGFDFQEMLREAQSNTQEAGQTASAGATGIAEIPGESVLPVNLLDGVKESSALRTQGVRATEKTLNLLEEYQRAIENPRVNLREIHPLIQSLAEETRGLNQWVGKLSSSDPLQKIMTEVGILSSIEVGRFNRGDYV